MNVSQVVFQRVLAESTRLEQIVETPTFFSLLDSLLSAAEEELSSFDLSKELFLGHLASSLLRHPTTYSLSHWFEHLQVKDLCLALGCGQGNGNAISTFEALYSSDLKRITLRFQKPHLPQEDLIQDLREKLFVGAASKPPKILSYAGQSPLKSWLKVTAVRTFLNYTKSREQRKREERIEHSHLLDIPTGFDLELEFLKQEYREHFRSSFQEALWNLEVRSQNLLYQHLVAGLSIDQLGAMLHIHRATAARHLAKARQSLLEGTRRSLMQKLNISSREFDSIMGLIQSRMELSVARLLAHAKELRSVSALSCSPKQRYRS